MTKKAEREEALKFLTKMDKWWLQRCSRELGLYLSGTKAQLAERIIAFLDLSPKKLNNIEETIRHDYIGNYCLRSPRRGYSGLDLY